MKPLAACSAEERLVNHFLAGAKAQTEWRVGIERECILIKKTGEDRTLPFAGQHSVQSIFDEFVARYGWQAIGTNEPRLGLKRDLQDITLEPASQIEIGTKPQCNLNELYSEVESFEQELRSLKATEPYHILFTGMDPIHEPDQKKWIPKKRYELMQARFRKTGDLGRWMMSMTASTQVSLDYSSERDCAEIIRCAASLTPIFTALYANSPIKQGKKSGWISFRTNIWMNTDPVRCGLPEFFFSTDNFFEKYVKFACHTPLLFIRDDQDKAMLNATDGELSFGGAIQKGHKLDMDDWILHLSTLFTEVRLKQLIEVRAPDGNRLPLAMTFPALLKAILYNGEARQAAFELTQKLSFSERQQALVEAAKGGLSVAKIGKHRMLDLASELYHFAEDALKALPDGASEQKLLEPLGEQIEKGVSPGEEMLQAWKGELKEDPEALLQWLSKTT